MDAVETRPIVEGALLAALTALLGLLAFYTGMGWVQPLPVLLAYLRHGFRTAALVSVVSAAVLGLWIGPVGAVAALGFVAALGMAPGWALRRGAGPAGTICCMTIAVIVFTVLGAAATMLIWHDNVWADLWAGVRHLLGTLAPSLKQAGLDPTTVGHMMTVLFPAFALIAAVAESALVYAVSAAVLSRLGQPVPAVPPFAAWRAPRWGIWTYVAALSIAVIGSRTGDKGVQAVAWNLLTAAIVVYSIAGLAYAYGWLRSRDIHRRRAIAFLAFGVWMLSATGLGVMVLPALGVFASHWEPFGSGR